MLCNELDNRMFGCRKAYSETEKWQSDCNASSLQIVNKQGSDVPDCIPSIPSKRSAVKFMTPTHQALAAAKVCHPHDSVKFRIITPHTKH